MGIFDVHTPFLANLFIGAIAAAILGLIIGIPSLKLKGPFLALATISSAALAHELLMPFSKYTGGEEGMAMPSSITIMPKDIYFISLLLMVICVGISYAISRSKYGTLLKAIREDESAAKAIGINTTKFKVGTFVISAAICGLAGAFHAYKTMVVSREMVDTALSLEIITYAVVGGIGTITGPIGGVYFLWILGFFLNSWIPEFKIIVYMILMIIIMLLMPKGLWTTVIEKITASFHNWKKSKG
jgi:branched-chain amino acid transport system permease protein